MFDRQKCQIKTFYQSKHSITPFSSPAVVHQNLKLPRLCSVKTMSIIGSGMESQHKVHDGIALITTACFSTMWDVLARGRHLWRQIGCPSTMVMMFHMIEMMTETHIHNHLVESWTEIQSIVHQEQLKFQICFVNVMINDQHIPCISNWKGELLWSTVNLQFRVKKRYWNILTQWQNIVCSQ